MTGKSEAWFTPSIHALQYQSVVVGRSQICCGRRGRAHRLRAPRGRSGQARQERKKYAFVPRPRPNALTALHQRRSSSRCDILQPSTDPACNARTRLAAGEGAQEVSGSRDASTRQVGCSGQLQRFYGGALVRRSSPFAKSCLHDCGAFV